MNKQFFWAFRHFLSNIPSINRGGCAIAALAMYKLGKSLGMNVQIMYLYNDSFRYSQNQMAKEGKDNPTGCHHAIIILDNMYFLDSTKDVNIYKYDYRHVVSEELVRSSLVQDAWNPDFDRIRYLREIEDVLGEKLLISQYG